MQYWLTNGNLKKNKNICINLNKSAAVVVHMLCAFFLTVDDKVPADAGLLMLLRHPHSPVT